MKSDQTECAILSPNEKLSWNHKIEYGQKCFNFFFRHLRISQSLKLNRSKILFPFSYWLVNSFRTAELWQLQFATCCRYNRYRLLKRSQRNGESMRKWEKEREREERRGEEKWKPNFGESNLYTISTHNWLIHNEKIESERKVENIPDRQTMDASHRTGVCICAHVYMCACGNK